MIKIRAYWLFGLMLVLLTVWFYAQSEAVTTAGVATQPQQLSAIAASPELAEGTYLGVTFSFLTLFLLLAAIYRTPQLFIASSYLFIQTLVIVEVVEVPLSVWLLHLSSFYLMSFVVMLFLMVFITHHVIADNAAKKKKASSLDEQDNLENKIQERTLELHIALQELADAHEELKKNSTIDELSGLYNRRFYDEKILAEFRRSRRNLTPLSLVVIDIDHFKKVNDTFGHLAGDLCITTVATRIKSCLRRSADIGCRYGGEEFCLILPETDKAGALLFAEELRATIAARTIKYQHEEISLTASCGVCTYHQEPDLEPENLFAAADKALFVAKELGRNQVQQQELI